MTTFIIQLCAFFLLPLIKATSCRECRCDPDIRSRPVPYSENNVNSGGTACEAGQYFNSETDRCTPCPSGTFMTREMSQVRVQTCLECLQARQGESVNNSCSATQDTEVVCRSGYYRSNWTAACTCDWGQCLRCHTCGLDYNLYRDHEVISCTQVQNTKCCEERNSDVDCSPKTTHRLPLVTTLRTLPTPVTTPQVNRHGSQIEQSLAYTSSKSSSKVCFACFLIGLLSTGF